MKIEIVSHVWNYSRLWTWQFSSLLLYPPAETRIKMTVCYSAEDEDTVRRMGEFVAWGGGSKLESVRAVDLSIYGRGYGTPNRCPKWPRNISLQPIEFDTPLLMRRAIGRNIAAIGSDADVVWFADCDMLFGAGTLDHLAEQYKWQPAHGLYRPLTVMRTDWPTGDRMILEATEFRGPLDAWRETFVPDSPGRAIGGCQIVSGDAARSMGYLPNHHYYQNPELHWKRTREDPVFRREMDKVFKCGGGLPLPLPNVMRIRHSQRGREVVGLKL